MVDWTRECEIGSIIFSLTCILQAFGFCTKVERDGSRLHYTSTGTTSYLAPEILDKELCRKGYDPSKSDIYSLGVTLFEMHIGKSPFKSSNP